MACAKLATTLLLTMLAASASAQTPPPDLRLAGSSALGHQLAPDLLAAFTTLDPNRLLRHNVTIDDTGAGLAALAEGRADIAMASRPATDDERVAQLSAGRGDPAAPGHANIVALEAIAVIVNRDNAIGILTLDQVHRLFSGQISNWSSLGGRDLPVTLYTPDRRSETFEAFETLALDHDQMADAADTGHGVADAVAADPGGIGFVPFAELGAAKPVTLALACGLTIEPKPFNIRTEDYPLVRRLYFYTGTEQSPPVQQFIQFALSAAAQPIVRQAGLIDLLPQLGAPGDALPKPGLWDPVEARRRQEVLTGLLQSLAGARRLSVTLRFGFGRDATTPDARALADIARVAAYMRANPGHKLILVGYWTGAGSFDADLAVSNRRAQQVATVLAGLGTPPSQLRAGGSLRPIACDEDARRDDRVEVWVR